MFPQKMRQGSQHQNHHYFFTPQQKQILISFVPLKRKAYLQLKIQFLDQFWMKSQ